MDLLLRGLSRIRKGLIWNALSGASLFGILASYYLTYSPPYIFPEDFPKTAPFLSSICFTYLWWLYTTILAIFYQYSGAVALLRSARKENPPHRGILRVSAILIIADPLFNVLSAAGMFLAPKRFLSGRAIHLWWIALPLFAIGQTGNILMFVLVPGTPGAYDAATWTFIGVNAVCILMNFLAYWMLWVVYKNVELTLPSHKCDRC